MGQSNRELMPKVTGTNMSRDDLFQEIRILKRPGNPVAPEESSSKFHNLTDPVIGPVRSGKIENRVQQVFRNFPKSGN
jgi:hypothetical protein